MCKNTDILKTLYKQWAKELATEIEKLPESGSNRQYYRICGANKTAIGVINNDVSENEAFLSFSQTFKNHNINVPEIYMSNAEKNAYLQQDLGNTTMFLYLEEKRENNVFTPQLTNICKKALSELLKLQITTANAINYSLCYPRHTFDRQSMQWDLNYFKYYFLKLADIPFNEQLLENDFDTLINYLNSADTNYFLFRDFQSRNIMVYNNELYFIDYQGGRKGALHYDVASLLYDAKANIPPEIRLELLEHYINELQKYKSVNKKEFIEMYYGYVLIRIMQAMGAFGFRGFFEQKIHFLQSIPYALKNMDYVIKNMKLPIHIPHLLAVLKQLNKADKLKKIVK